MPEISKPSLIEALQKRMSGFLPNSQEPSQPLPSPPMGGMAGQAQGAISGRAYQLYAQEAQAMGQTPVSAAAFAAGQR